MKISGTILNAEDYTPIAVAKIKLKVQDKEIATVFSDEHGQYEYTADEDYVGKGLIYTIEKDGFEEKNFCSVIDKTEINKKFLLREREISDRWTKLRWLFYGIVLFAAVIFLWSAAYPEPTLEYNIHDQNITNLELNSKYQYVCNISYPWYSIPAIFGKTGDWSLGAADKWVYVTTESGTGPEENIELWVYTPDNEYSPNRYQPYDAIINLNYKKLFGWGKKEYDLNLDIKETKKYWPILSVNLIDTYPIVVTKPDTQDFAPLKLHIENKNEGELYWTIRDNVSWIKLLVNGKEQDTGKVFMTDYRNDKIVDIALFDIDFVRVEEELGNERSVTGRITVESNNDGKMKVYIKVTRDSDNFIISHEKTEDWSSWNSTEFYS